MTHVFTSLEQITPTALTSILRGAGVLPQGEVHAVSPDGNLAFNSTITHLHLTYSRTAPPTAPRQLLLKRGLPAEWAIKAGAREVAFYQLIERLPARLPMIVPCYDAGYDAATGSSHVLLHDFSSTHRAPLTRDQVLTTGHSVPDDRDCVAVVDTLARFHAYWWEHPFLGTGIVRVGGWWQDHAQYMAELKRRETAWAGLIAAEQGWFPDDLQCLYKHALDALPRLWERYLAPRVAGLGTLTVTHNDAYFSNFLCPREGMPGETYLIDWQGPAAGRGADDLVNLMATFWAPTERAEGQRETRLLRRYYDALHTYGVKGYTWDDLLVDYKIGLIEWLFVPAQDRADGSARDYWWPKLQCLAAAYRDWNCAELLHG